MKRLLLILTALLTALLSAREVRLTNMVCNPGAYVVVPVTLDDANGLAVASFVLTYDPQVLVLHEVRQGSLAEHFNFDFSVVEDTGSVEVVSVAEENITANCGGTLAEVAFYVRDGSDSLYSSLTLAEVRFYEETMTRDMTLANATMPKHGLVRPLLSTMACQTRLGEGAMTVAAGTTLRTLSLSAEDALQASGDGVPITVTETLSSKGTIRVVAPSEGWTTARYPILKCLTADLNFTIVDAPKEATIECVEEDGMMLYSVAAVAEGALPITTEAEMALTANEQTALRQLVSATSGATEIKAVGSQEAIEMSLDLGIEPEVVTEDGVATATFGLPTIEIISFDVAMGKVTAKIVPPEGASLGRVKPATGIIHLYGTDSLSTAMQEIETAEVDLEPYLKDGTKGEFAITVQFGTKTFFRVTAGRTAEKTMLISD